MSSSVILHGLLNMYHSMLGVGTNLIEFLASPVFDLSEIAEYLNIDINFIQSFLPFTWGQVLFGIAIFAIIQWSIIKWLIEFIPGW